MVRGALAACVERGDGLEQLIQIVVNEADDGVTESQFHAATGGAPEYGTALALKHHSAWMMRVVSVELWSRLALHFVAARVLSVMRTVLKS
jgi:hypothetical protein